MELVQALSAERHVAAEAFVCGNADAKEGGVDSGDFAIASPVPTAGCTRSAADATGRVGSGICPAVGTARPWAEDRSPAARRRG
ncbi:hypothetical protein [Streptomyces sp. NPDC006552]|uniref:hypothetical protein n=1 Tax=Streptomyces sp. NPDC006552 TaxID=3157179 RepID=UPI0033A9DB4D